MARHLAFIDRLLADKDKLSAKCMQLGKDMKVNCMQPKLPLLAVNVYLLHQRLIRIVQYHAMPTQISRVQHIFLAKAGCLLTVALRTKLRTMQNCIPCKILHHAKPLHVRHTTQISDLQHIPRLLKLQACSLLAAPESAYHAKAFSSCTQPRSLICGIPLLSESHVCSLFGCS